MFGYSNVIGDKSSKAFGSFDYSEVGDEFSKALGASFDETARTRSSKALGALDRPGLVALLGLRPAVLTSPGPGRARLALSVRQGGGWSVVRYRLWIRRALLMADSPAETTGGHRRPNDV